MKILIAEDDPFFRRLLQKLLATDFEVIAAEDGTRAWSMIQESEVPLLAILDWVMPGMAGPELCREVRSHSGTANHYLILLTGKNSSADILAGLRAGADDYITKPFEPEELRARVRVGRRVIELQQQLADLHALLEVSMRREKLLQDRLATQEKAEPSESVTKGASA